MDNNQSKRSISAYTDYPIVELGDQPFKPAPVRPVEVLEYDGDKYCIVNVEGVMKDIKAGYIYNSPKGSPGVSEYQLDRSDLERLMV